MRVKEGGSGGCWAAPAPDGSSDTLAEARLQSHIHPRLDLSPDSNLSASGFYGNAAEFLLSLLGLEPLCSLLGDMLGISKPLKDPGTGSQSSQLTLLLRFLARDPYRNTIILPGGCSSAGLRPKPSLGLSWFWGGRVPHPALCLDTQPPLTSAGPCNDVTSPGAKPPLSPMVPDLFPSCPPAFHHPPGPNTRLKNDKFPTAL